MSAESAWLDCDHCGGAAVRSETGLFYDGQGDECESCGMPGTVFCDSETDPYWHDSQDDDARCTRPECEECNEDRDTSPFCRCETCSPGNVTCNPGPDD